MQLIYSIRSWLFALGVSDKLTFVKLRADEFGTGGW